MQQDVGWTAPPGCANFAAVSAAHAFTARQERRAIERIFQSTARDEILFHNVSLNLRTPSSPVGSTVNPSFFTSPMIRLFCGSASPTISRVPRERQ